MKNNIENSKITNSMDLLIPYIGELIGGSEREENYEKLMDKMKNHHMNNIQQYQWYLDIRKYGTMPHAGFGLGFERLIQLFTGIKNIRDVTLISRTRNSCQF